MEAVTNNVLHHRPLLSVREQIDHLKSVGVAFDLCDETEAERYLADKTYYFKLASYRTLFPRRIGGSRDGQYVDLDFAYLKDLASLDQRLRYNLLPMTLDVEHFAKTGMVRELTQQPDEDGYEIVTDYLNGLSSNNRKRRENELRILDHDVYCGNLLRKYKDGMPLWVFVELVSFGTFIDLYRFCAIRWKNDGMQDEHYLLRQTKAVRNACAHSSNIINGFADKSSSIETNAAVSRAIAQTGISKRVRTAKMHNARLQQIATLLYLHAHMVVGNSTREMTRTRLTVLKQEMLIVKEELASNDVVRSSFSFLIGLFDSWFLDPHTSTR